MNQRFYSVFDNKTSMFLTPFTCVTNGAALRSFADICNANDSVIHKHLEDYALYYIGEFSQDLGAFLPDSKAVFLESALNLVQAPNGQQG